MASLYKNNGIWYVSTLINGTRKTKSLKTKERKKAFAKMPSTLSNILQQSNHLNNDITFEDLTKLFLDSNNHWSKNTSNVGVSLNKKAHECGVVIYMN